MYILNFEEFIIENKVIEERRNLLINVMSQISTDVPFMNESLVMINTGMFDDIFEGNINEESIAAKMKAKFDAAVNTAKTKGKEALSNTQELVIRLGGSIANVIKLMVQKLKEWVSENIQKAKSFYKNQVSSRMGDIEKAIDNAQEETKNTLVKEIKNLKSISSSVLSWVSSGFVSDATKAAAGAVKEGLNFELNLLKHINESVINKTLDFSMFESEGHSSGIPYVSTIAHKMHHIPPFNLLDKVKSGAEKVAAGTLNRFSYYATELAGAPGPFEFKAMASLIGIITEVQFKGVAKHLIISAIPGLGLILSLISHAAMALALIGVVETLIEKS
jgi:hypothetical protein